MIREVDFRLFPDVIYEGRRYSHFDEESHLMRADSNIPFLRVYNDAKKNDRLILIGDGSLGKTTSLRVFEAKMLCENKKCLLFECKNINCNDVTRIETFAQRQQVSILIFDAYDELQDSVRESFNELIDKLNQYNIQIIVSSRFDPRTGHVSEATSEIFGTYLPMYICDFTDEQLNSLVSKTISRNSGYYGLLKNTMLLSLHLQLEKNNLLDTLVDSIKTEAQFIQQYFERLYLDKLSNEVQLSDLIHLGKYIHNQRIGRSNRYEERIPTPLRHIFEYAHMQSDGNCGIDLISHQVKYLNYLHALYLKECLLTFHDDMDDEELILATSKLLNMPSTLEISESVYYAGQLLTPNSETTRILAALNESKIKSCTRYENVLCLFLGYNNDVAEDIPGIFEFYHPIMRDKYHDYLHACDRIRELRAPSIQEVHFGYSGFAQLEKIDIDNDVYYSKGNCLIKKSDNGLYIGCHSSEIPDGVMYIHSHAFSYCNIKNIVLPSSVRELDRFAFKYCEMLEYVELGDGVNKVTRDAFYKCSAIKTVCIKNNYMQIGHESYDLRAFIRVPKLEKAIVPTTAISYIYKIAPHSLKYLEISQGRTHSSLVPLTFDDVEQTNQFKELVIRSDVEYIAEDAFIKFKNNLERIYIEPGCTAYSSINNCLISNKENAIVLGCKNSIIPQTGIKRIKSYAFARCDIQHIDITEDIESVGTKAFYKCYELSSLHVSTGLKLVDVDAFAYCFKLAKVSIESVDQWAQIFFSTVLSNPLFFAKSLQCQELQNNVLNLTDGIPLITSGAFNYCRGIKKVVIPSSVKEIRGCAFLHCNDIEEVHIKDIASWVSTKFNSFSANPLSLGARLFLSGSEAKDLVFDKNTIINKHSLIRTQSLESVTLEDGCDVGFEAFKECPNLTRVTIKSANIKLNPSSFRGCTVQVFFFGSEDEWQSITNGELEGVSSVSICR